MIARIATDLAKVLLNTILMIAIVGFLMAGGVMVKLWRNRP